MNATEVGWLCFFIGILAGIVITAIACVIKICWDQAVEVAAERQRHEEVLRK